MNFKELKLPGYVIYINSADSASVLALQKQLNKWGYTDAYGSSLAEDGEYGINTYNAVIKYQMDNGLEEDGKVGDKTWESMSNRVKQDEFNNALSSGNTNAYYADSELNIGGMNPSMYRNTNKSNKSSGFNLGKAVKSIYDYNKANNGLPKKSYTDGYVESELQRIEAQGGIEDNTLKQEEEWLKVQAEDLAKKGNYMGAFTLGLYD